MWYSQEGKYLDGNAQDLWAGVGSTPILEEFIRS